MAKTRPPAWILDIVEPPELGLSHKDREALDRQELGSIVVKHIRSNLAHGGDLDGVNEPDEENRLWLDVIELYEDPEDQALIFTGLLGEGFNVTWSPWLGRFEVQDRTPGFLRSYICDHEQVLTHRTEEPAGERWRQG